MKPTSLRTILLAAALALPAVAGATALCARLGDRIGGRPDVDTFGLRAGAPMARVILEARSDPAGSGARAELRTKENSGDARLT